MKNTFLRLLVFFLLLITIKATAAVRYVDLASTNATLPYTDWSIAATNIQDAINASTAGDVVWVTNGTYSVGGKVMSGDLTNRVALDKALTVQSVNGPGLTSIQGVWDPTTNGNTSVRCAWLTNGAVLSGFTLIGGATRAVASNVTPEMSGGGVWGASTSAILSNCIVTANTASYNGGGAYQVTLNRCLVTRNHALGTFQKNGSGSGGGAVNCNLNNCFINSNDANPGEGGGVLNCNLKNCALTKNSSSTGGGAVSMGKLVNCTVMGNTSAGMLLNDVAVFNATLTNCIVWGNFSRGFISITNHNNCSMSYSCSAPLPSGTGNISTDPQLLQDGIHLAFTSPCRAAGRSDAISGSDFDGQSWASPPSMGCDEWQAAAAVSPQPQAGLSGRYLTFSITPAGQAPFTYYWKKDGVLIQDNAQYSFSGTAQLRVNNFGPADAGLYQVVVSNISGTATSQIARIIIHCVQPNGTNPIVPYASWETAATNIQDAIDAGLDSDIVLVTNGIYASGSRLTAGNMANRAVVNKAMTVTSVNGFTTTAIQGSWDPNTTNGPLAVRCVWLADGAVLNGFTLQGGATRETNSTSGGLGNGGGACCASTNVIISNCRLINNSAHFGGGAYLGTLNSCLVISNIATVGSALYASMLNNCTVTYNTTTIGTSLGPTPYCIARNCILLYNIYPSGADVTGTFLVAAYCLTTLNQTGTGNITGEPRFIDSVHISSTSPCRGAGSALYATATDIDGEPWANPPSIGCDEVIESNLIGPLSVNISAYLTNGVANYFYSRLFFIGSTTGLVTHLDWSFGDGPIVTNTSFSRTHSWTNAGDYIVSFTAYNTDNPLGVSASLPVHIDPLLPTLLQTPVFRSNEMSFQFSSQKTVIYNVQYATNLSSPINWKNIVTPSGTGDLISVTDPIVTNVARFYRVVAATPPF